MKKNQTNQLKRDKTMVRLEVKIGSSSNILLINKSQAIVRKKKSIPIENPCITSSNDREKETVEKPLARQITNSSKTAFLSVGRENNDE
jgi:hypothetical protein